jgi:hypothetical protein
MFNPSQNDVRRFFCDTLAKRRRGEVLTPLETIAADWLEGHPEYHDEMADAEAAVAANYDGSDGRANPFLHLSMHLSISEQIGIDQPRGIKQAFELLRAKRGSAHDAQHEVMECLGEMLWNSQRTNQPPDGDAYIDCVRRRATR